MKKLKVLNLYAGLGGNMKYWENCEITSIENNPVIASINQDYFPQHKVLVCDAHEYLLNHYQDFDFIWSSPPCQTHSRARQILGVQSGKVLPGYLDLSLYQEVIFLQSNCKVPWVVENVIPYYKPLIPPQLIGRHYFWSNVAISKKDFERDDIEFSTIKKLSLSKGFDLSKYKIPNKRQILRNCVNPDLGLYIFNQVNRLPGEIKNKKNTLFEELI